MLERMEDFFARRIDGYEEHMLQEVEGCEEGYRRMATLVPGHTLNLLDLGCGTGLELQAIWGKKAGYYGVCHRFVPPNVGKAQRKVYGQKYDRGVRRLFPPSFWAQPF